MRRLIALIILASMAGPVASDTIPARADQYRRTLTRYAQIHLGMTAPVALFGAQIHQESRWRPDAKSKYAAGLAQFTGPTAGDMGRWYRRHLGETNVYSPDWALQALVLYNKRLFGLVKKNLKPETECDAWAFTLSSYNGGYGNTLKEFRFCSRMNNQAKVSGFGCTFQSAETSNLYSARYRRLEKSAADFTGLGYSRPFGDFTDSFSVLDGFLGSSGNGSASHGSLFLDFRSSLELLNGGSPHFFYSSWSVNLPKKVVFFAKPFMDTVVLSKSNFLKVGWMKVSFVFINMVNKILSSQTFSSDRLVNEPVYILGAGFGTDRRVSVQHKNLLSFANTDFDQTSLKFRTEVAYQHLGIQGYVSDRSISQCNPFKWWGNVETHCRRADWACRENRDYPRKIIFRWQPLYQAAGWGGPTICEEMQ